MTRKRNRKPNGHRRSNPRRPHQGVLPSIEPPNPTAAPAGQGQLNTTAQPRFGLSSWRETREGARLLDQIGVGHGGGVARERGRPSAEYGADYGADGQEAGGYNVMGRGMGASQNAAGYIVPEGRLKRGIGGGSFVVAGDHTGYNACINAGHGDYSAGYRAQYGSGNDAGYHAKYSRGHVAGYNAKSQLRGNDLSHLIHHDRVSEAAVNAASNLLLPVHPRNRASSAYVPLENDEEFGSGELIEPPCVAALRDTDSVASNTRDTSLNCIFCGGRGHRTGECPDRWGNEGRRAEGIQDQAVTADFRSDDEGEETQAEGYPAADEEPEDSAEGGGFGGDTGGSEPGGMLYF
ncbi:uncharacterized protein BO97DRAFT_422239 [Aspergillus homomorphus CBS 101889]|uniref:CCHC-type domain-containing protein n=1 Tax=Aspergillus homomorphus (strain CBS 101889) TaxID=1450537 RepID=A0A395I549_ASPHC|nr:hypothetical protein BO97DRAFT_422239 [Aspergillus homomorphus CBS 101889]RAL14886.1 hypothetical protein BO97DRAFT_422239 [Aspergillus homomorphus CBS 101889]